MEFECLTDCLGKNKQELEKDKQELEEHKRQLEEKPSEFISKEKSHDLSQLFENLQVHLKANSTVSDVVTPHHQQDYFTDEYELKH